MNQNDLTKVLVKEYLDGVQRDKYRAEYFKDYGMSPYWYGVCSCPNTKEQ